MARSLSIDRIHSLRALSAVLEARTGAGLLLLGPTGPPALARATTDGAFRALGRLLEERPAFRDELEAALRSAPLGRSVRLPGGLVGAIAPVDLVEGPGRLIALPLASSERDRRAFVETLRTSSVRPTSAERAGRSLSIGDGAGASLVKTLLAVAEEEIGSYTRAVERAERSVTAAANTLFPTLIGDTPSMRALYFTMERVAASDGTVYIHGENGTGKELVAAAIHGHSRRAGRPYVTQNCSALNDNLLESELFGHRRGAFTGASVDKPGLFELAHTGSFFLDEVGDMSPALQVKLLRVIQEGTFTAVGDTGVKKIDVRVICATHRDLERMASEGAFRTDLFYRINVLPIRVPPLRERAADIPILAESFLLRAQTELGQPESRKRFAPDAMAALQAYPWPGNVRELVNEVERVVVMSGPFVTRIGADALSPHIVRRRPVAPSPDRLPGESLPAAVARLERAMIEDALETCRGNKSRAATVLGVSRRNLIRRCQELGFGPRQSARSLSEVDGA